ncbi:hypothetical protein DPMN_122019 [Dreissena polymorpha]|uniref:Uncharacterized protein n=1 Tax=Dreissena polymorpha TaxID=45954 RepID=A0A9D4GR53_DREPO|nr:hypothetical protein DPMN_122019 [Dreissena polymorpha]
MSPRVYMYESSGYLCMPDEAVVQTNWRCKINQNSVVSCRHVSATFGRSLYLKNKRDIPTY